MDTEQKPPRLPEDVFAAFHGALGLVEGRHSARLFCHADQPDHVACIMTVTPSDQSWVERGGQRVVQGTVTHVFRIDPDFRCASRPTGVLNTKSCVACQAHVGQEGLTLEVDPAFKNFF